MIVASKIKSVTTRQFVLLTICICLATVTFGQTDLPKEITPQLLAQINKDVEKQAAVYKRKLAKNDISKDEIEFSIDTFKLSQTVSKRMDIDYSTVGMNRTIIEMAEGYDRLLNKYYNKLLKLLDKDDKKVLITAQKAWLNFRDAEKKLIGTMTKEKYSGGGTIQSNIAVSAYADLVVKRTEEIFNYYNTVIKED